MGSDTEILVANSCNNPFVKGDLVPVTAHKTIVRRFSV